MLEEYIELLRAQIELQKLQIAERDQYMLQMQQEGQALIAANTSLSATLQQAGAALDNERVLREQAINMARHFALASQGRLEQLAQQPAQISSPSMNGQSRSYTPALKATKSIVKKNKHKSAVTRRRAEQENSMILEDAIRQLRIQ